MATNCIIDSNEKYANWTVGHNWCVDANWRWKGIYDWTLNVTESMLLLGGIIRDFDTVLFEKFSITDNDKTINSYQLNNSTSLSFSDSLHYYTSYIRKYSESIGVSDSLENKYYLYEKDSFGVDDAINRAIKCVLSDIIFENGSWNIDSFNDAMYKGKHAGYDTFRPFVTGDYSYEKALFRVAMDTTGTDIAVVEQFIIDVDVPDITDRGSASVIDKNFNLIVKFNRTFHIAPEVTITMRSGSSATPIVPVVDSVTEKQFEMHLMNAITGENVDGSFIWSAVGY